MNLFKLFITFFKIGAFTFGGGYAMLPLIEEEVVEKNKWVTSEEFLDAIAVAQSSPGPVSVNTSIFIGYKLRGFIGSLICTLGTILPSFLIILLVAVFFYQFRDNPIVDKVFMGIRPAVAALILSSVYKLGKKSKVKINTLMISIAALAAVIFLNLSPIIVILAGGIGAIVYYKRKLNDDV